MAEAAQGDSDECGNCEAHTNCCFRELPPQSLQKFRGLLLLRRYGPGVIVFREGEPADGIFVVRSGWLRLTHISQEGKSVIIGFVGPGGILGLTEVMTGCTHHVGAEVLEECELEYLRSQSFLPFLENNPKLAVTLLAAVSHDVRRSVAEVCALAGKLPLQERLFCKLQELAESCGQPTPRGIQIRLPFTVQELADSLGCSRQWTTKLLYGLEEQGLIRRRQSWITLTQNPKA